MIGKIGLEEHFAISDTILDSFGFLDESVWPELKARLLDVGEKRLRYMDASGLEIMILSLNAPAIQAIPEPARALEIARRANDFLAERVAEHPDRFAALAALPMQDADSATGELERCIETLGFKGALVNGFSEIAGEPGAVYLDDPRYRAFWHRVEGLDVPFYLHPRNPLPADAGIYGGHPWLLGPSWAFGQEGAVHALRLMGSGLFDECPGLKIILGHLGEGIPYSLWRIDNRNGWVGEPPDYPAKRSIAEYFQENFWLTTSGNFHNQTLLDALFEIGAGHILFSIDYPFEDVADAAGWFDAAPISEADRARIGRLNAVNLFKLGEG